MKSPYLDIADANARIEELENQLATQKEVQKEPEIPKEEVKEEAPINEKDDMFLNALSGISQTLVGINERLTSLEEKPKEEKKEEPQPRFNTGVDPVTSIPTEDNSYENMSVEDLTMVQCQLHPRERQAFNSRYIFPKVSGQMEKLRAYK